MDITGGVVSGTCRAIGTAGDIVVIACVPGSDGSVVMNAAYTVNPAAAEMLGMDQGAVAIPVGPNVPWEFKRPMALGFATDSMRRASRVRGIILPSPSGMP